MSLIDQSRRDKKLFYNTKNFSEIIVFKTFDESYVSGEIPANINRLQDIKQDSNVKGVIEVYLDVESITVTPDKDDIIEVVETGEVFNVYLVNTRGINKTYKIECSEDVKARFHN